MAKQSACLKRPAPADGDGNGDRPNKLSRTDSMSPEVPKKGSGVSKKPSPRASSTSKNKPTGQKVKDCDAFIDLTNSVAQPSKASSGSSDAFTGARNKGTQNNTKDNHNLQSDPAEPTPVIDLTDYLPTIGAASSAAPPNTLLQNLLKDVTTTKRGFEEQDSTESITLAHVVAMIQRWEGQLWQGIQDMEDAEDARIYTLNKDIDRQFAHEAKHDAQLAAKERLYKKRLAEMEKQHELKMKAMKEQMVVEKEKVVK
jgi:hypothetical protein